MKLTAILAAATVALSIGNPAQADERTNPDKLYFGILATENSTAQREK